MGGSGRNERREWEESEEEVGGMRGRSGRNERRKWEE